MASAPVFLVFLVPNRHEKAVQLGNGREEGAKKRSAVCEQHVAARFFGGPFRAGGFRQIRMPGRQPARSKEKSVCRESSAAREGLSG